MKVGVTVCFLCVVLCSAECFAQAIGAGNWLGSNGSPVTNVGFADPIEPNLRYNPTTGWLSVDTRGSNCLVDSPADMAGLIPTVTGDDVGFTSIAIEGPAPVPGTEASFVGNFAFGLAWTNVVYFGGRSQLVGNAATAATLPPNRYDLWQYATGLSLMDFDVNGSGAATAEIGLNSEADVGLPPIFTQLQLAATGSVVNRHVFYNHSSWDGNDPALNANDNNAIATDKSPYYGHGSSSFDNVTSFRKGITGAMVDIDDANWATLSLDDFEFYVGNDNSPGGWTTAPTPTFDVSETGGVGGTTRVSFAWADGEIQDEWLQVVVLPTTDTNIECSDIHYWANLAGETGDDSAVTISDVLITNGTIADPTTITTTTDFDRDAAVTISDVLFSNSNIPHSLAMLDNAGISTPPAIGTLVPEAATLHLALAGLLTTVLLVRRRVF